MATYRVTLNEESTSHPYSLRATDDEDMGAAFVAHYRAAGLGPVTGGVHASVDLSAVGVSEEMVRLWADGHVVTVAPSARRALGAVAS